MCDTEIINDFDPVLYSGKLMQPILELSTLGQEDLIRYLRTVAYSPLCSRVLEVGDLMDPGFRVMSKVFDYLRNETGMEKDLIKSLDDLDYRISGEGILQRSFVPFYLGLVFCPLVDLPLYLDRSEDVVFLVKARLESQL